MTLRLTFGALAATKTAGLCWLSFVAFSAWTTACTQPIPSHASTSAVRTPPPAAGESQAKTEVRAHVASATPSTSVELARFAAYPIVSQSDDARGHLVEPYSLTVRIDPEAVEAYQSCGRQPFPIGTTLVAEYGVPRRPPLGPTYVMHKATGGWSFRAFDERGAQLPIESALCQRCHTEAGRDSVFCLPPVH
jgi:hypothetical protein